jgi:predicted nuclease of predicted toxin-antitoxin system
MRSASASACAAFSFQLARRSALRASEVLRLFCSQPPTAPPLRSLCYLLLALSDLRASVRVPSSLHPQLATCSRPGVAELVERRIPKAEVESIHHYADGSLLNTTDDEVLAEAHRDGWSLVTFDLNTIPRLLSEKAMVKEDHSGIVFISSKSFAQNDHVRLAQALRLVAQSEAEKDWTNRVMFLSRKETSQS